MNLRQELRRPHLLAVVGLSLGLLGIAFAVHPVRASPHVFWALVGLAVAISLPAMRITIPSSLRRKPPDPRLVGPECRRVSDEIARLVSEQWASIFSGINPSQLSAWRETTENRYMEDLQEWALGVFDDAVSCGVVSRGARRLVRRPRAEQLEKVRDLFREAADSLEDL